MRILDQFSYAGNSVKTRKTRAGLTTLGITIGIAAIVSLLALSNGFQAAITKQFELGFSTKTLTVTKNTGTLGGIGGTPDPNFHLYVNDSEIIAGLSQHITLVVPHLQQPSSGCNVTVAGKNYTLNTIVGVNFTAYGQLYPTTFATTNGSIPTGDTNTSIVIGSNIAKDPLNYKVGDSINLTWYEYGHTGLEPTDSHSYTALVAAILPEIGGFSLAGPSDNGVYIQITPAINFFNTNISSSITVLLNSETKAVINEVTNVIENEYNHQVSVISSTAVLNTINSIFNFITVFIAAIAGISLVVAGVGIMNVQITSVLERTREIGILKAIGAKDRTILSVFLFETLLLGLLGSALGIGVGWVLSSVFGSMIGGFVGGGSDPFGGNISFGGGVGAASSTFSNMSISPILTPNLIFWAVMFGVIIAILFGLYPAYRASRLKPVDALRSE
ncbi:MAG: Cell division protein FtsX [Promethearchaeota archaeon CR_4]|nr:MAG: Cell division protein FtsX [Candidatus Lokiarchaeota archaeon CR_4]